MYNSNSHPLAIRGNAAGFSSLYEALSTIHVFTSSGTTKNL